MVLAHSPESVQYVGVRLQGVQQKLRFSIALFLFLFKGQFMTQRLLIYRFFLP